MILIVFVPMLVDGALGLVSMTVGLALFVGAVVAFLSTVKAAQDDYRDRTEQAGEDRAE